VNEKPPKPRKTWSEGNHWHPLRSMIAAICAMQSHSKLESEFPLASEHSP